MILVAPFINFFLMFRELLRKTGRKSCMKLVYVFFPGGGGGTLLDFVYIYRIKM